MVESGRSRAANRPTENARLQPNSVANISKLSKTHSERKRGRPPGSRNQPKALIPKEMANEFLGVVKDLLPAEYYDDMKAAIRSGKNISTTSEAKILLKLMGPPVWMRLIQESRPVTVVPQFDPELEEEIGSAPQTGVQPFDKDLNERIKVLIQLMQFVSKLEQNDEATNTDQKPILEVFARRGIDAARIDFITNPELRTVGGNVDGTGRGSLEFRAIPSEVPERQIDVPDSQQE
jgi:hypothetical protein